MANNENLIPLNQRTKRVQREIQSKAGITSAKNRRQKKIDEHYFKILMGLPISGEKNIAKLLEMGVDPKNFKNEMLPALSLMKLIVEKNDLDAIKYGDELMGKNPSLELKKQELEIKRRQSKDFNSKNTNAMYGDEDDKLLEAFKGIKIDWNDET
ncbi:MAG: hypothetical protein FWF15_08780 [Oscillospiraceae bacterium]|nr:hypothetical protein [Oscillospiraceae bacterium]